MRSLTTVIAAAAVATVGVVGLAACSTTPAPAPTTAAPVTPTPTDSMVGGDPATWTPVQIDPATWVAGTPVVLVPNQRVLFTGTDPAGYTIDVADPAIVLAEPGMADDTATTASGLVALAPGTTTVTVTPKGPDAKPFPAIQIQVNARN